MREKVTEIFVACAFQDITEHRQLEVNAAHLVARLCVVYNVRPWYVGSLGLKLGIKGVTVYSWQAFAAPKGLPANVKARLQPALIAAIRNPDTVKKFADQGFEVVGSSPAEFDKFLADEVARWKQGVEQGGIKQSD